MAREQSGVRITFDLLTRAEAARAAAELRQLLINSLGDDVVVSVERDDVEAQDAGATLVLLFGAPAAVAIAKGIRAYLAKRPSTGITIRTTAEGTEVIVTGEAARNVDPVALANATLHPKR